MKSTALSLHCAHDHLHHRLIQLLAPSNICFEIQRRGHQILPEFHIMKEEASSPNYFISSVQNIGLSFNFNY